METPETDSRQPIKRPACDNCKSRKTKCDRQTPCSSCTTLEIPCQTSRRSPEKRQRVLISNKYTEEIQDVNLKLEGIQRSLQALTVQRQDVGTNEPSKAFSPPQIQPAGLCRNLDTSRGFRGQSSFEAHVEELRNLLRQSHHIDSLQALASSSVFPQTTPSSQAPTASPGSEEPAKPSGRDLPPTDLTLQLLRVIQEERQRFFLDVPFLDENDFIGHCKAIYFPTAPDTACSWAVVNAGLYHIFHDLGVQHYARLRLTTSTVHDLMCRLSANVHEACSTLQMCTEASLENCQALAVLGNFTMKAGYIETAWRLLSSATRTVMDMGMQYVQVPDIQVQEKRKGLVWWLYSMTNSFALALGRVPILRRQEITLGYPDFQHKVHGKLFHLYEMFLEFPNVIEEINDSVFSASALKLNRHERNARAEAATKRLQETHCRLKQMNRDAPEIDLKMIHAAVLMEIILHSLLALVQYPTFDNEGNMGRLRYSDTCVDASRKAIGSLVEVSKVSLETSRAKFLNTTLSMMPLVPFVVLIGNAIATASTADLGLLSTMVHFMQPVAVESPLMHNVCRECENLYGIATSFIGQRPLS